MESENLRLPPERQVNRPRLTTGGGSHPGKSDEHIIDMVDAIANDRAGEFVVNIVNRDNLVPGVPLDFQVEVKARLSAAGLQTRPSKPLPRSIIAHLYRDRIAPVEMELAAYEHGSYEILVELILMGRWAPSKQAAESFLDEVARPTVERVDEGALRPHADGWRSLSVVISLIYGVRRSHNALSCWLQLLPKNHSMLKYLSIPAQSRLIGCVVCS